MEQGKKPSLVNHFSFAVVIIGLLVFKQPDMGTSAILIAIAFFSIFLPDCRPSWSSGQSLSVRWGP